MSAATTDPLRLRLPGFRRYARELERLKGQVSELEALRAQLAVAEQENRILRAARGLSPGDEIPGDDVEWVNRARKFEYYWLNADKKIDLFALKPFAPLAARVLEDGRTFLNADRLYTLWQAIEKMPDDTTAVAEVGVFKGGSSKFLAEALLAVHRTVPLFACDTFSGHTAVDESLDGRHRVGKQFRSRQAPSLAPKVSKYLRKYDFVHVMEGDIRETASGIANQVFGMVHLDVDVHPITVFCLDFFTPRLARGGTIVVDDYGFTTCRGVKKAVDDFVAANHGRVWAMHLLTGQAVLTRLR
jgi:O-methyltransferase